MRLFHQHLFFFNTALILVLSVVVLPAQHNHVRFDSLRQELLRCQQQAQASHDSILFSLHFSIALELTDIQPDSSISYAQHALLLAQRLSDSSKIADTYYTLGYGLKNRGYFKRAVESHLTGIKIAENIADTSKLLLNLNGLGITYMAQQQFGKAQQHFDRCFALSQKKNNLNGMKRALSNEGYVLWKLKQYDSAIVYHLRSLRIEEDLQDTVGIGISYINLGVCFQGKRDFTEALRYLEHALQIHRHFGNTRNEILSRYYLGWTLHDMAHYREALPHLIFATTRADSLKMHSPLQDAYRILSDTYSALGLHEESTYALRQYIGVKDSLYSQETALQIEELQLSYENEKKDKQLTLLHQEQTQQRFERNVYGLGLILVLGFSAMLLWAYRMKSRANAEVLRQKSILEEQAREIELANTKLHENNLQLHSLNTSVEQKVAELEAIDAIVQSINNEVELEKLLPKLLEQGHALVSSAEKSSILLLDEETRTYRFIAFRGYNPDMFSHLRFSPEETRIRYIHTKPVQEGVYVLREYEVEIENGAKFTNAPPECSLVMTISLDRDEPSNFETTDNTVSSGDDLPDGIIFFDNYSSANAFTNLDIERIQRFRKHVITAFAKAKIVKAEHEAATRLAKQNLRLQELDKEKNEFLGIAAHDMKSPLAGIMTGVGILRRFSEKLSTTEKLKLLQNIEQTTRRMSDIISNLLDINAIESGKMNLHIHNFDLVTLTKETIEQYRDRAVAKDIAIFTEFDDETAFTLADSSASAQILDNLISNAIKYSPRGKNVVVRIKNSHSPLVIGLWSDGNTPKTSPDAAHKTNDQWQMTNDQATNNQRIRVEVSDEGQGISAEDMQRMFGKFARLSPQPTGGEDSTGLGLSIVKRLTEAMNGRVWCESEVGKGATFIVELPKM
jgi:signal transduction histidine kinase/Tfp pilus assembly protein PilF